MPVPNWQYHEPAHPGADFDAIAEVYDRNMKKVRDVQGEIDEILDFLDLKHDHTVLEIGTGTGELAMAAARYCARVYAVDLSSGMLNMRRKRLPQEILEMSIFCREVFSHMSIRAVL